MSALRSFRRGRLRSVRSIAVVSVLVLAALLFIGSAQAVHDNGMFELDGNTANDATAVYDWNDLFNADGTQKAAVDPINGPLLADTFVSDAATPDQSYFTSNKDIQPIASGNSHWGCDPINNPLNKDDLQNAYAAVIQVPADSPDTANAGHQVLYMGSERGSNNGTSFAGFWLLKDPTVGCSGSNDFSGQHQDGDILIISDYTNGGGTQDVSVYRWTGDDATGKPVLDTSFNGSICSGTLTNDNACAIANSATITTPWSPTSHDANTFVETGIDLTTLLGADGGCFTNFLAETRSSDVLTATLKDFARGSLDTCVPPIIATTATPGGSTNPLGVSNQHDVATITKVDDRPDPTGTVDFFLCNPSQLTNGACESGGTQVGGDVTVDNNGSATSDNAPGSLTNTTGKYCWRAEYTPDTDGAKFYVAGSHTNSTTECFTVVKNTPTLVTNASTTGGGVVGTGTTCDSATLSGTFSGTGTITFTLTAPNSSTSTVGSVTVNGNGTYQSPSCPLLTQVGTYTWHATYSGDSLNNGAVDNGANESVTSIKATPTLVTNASTTGGGVVGTGTTCDSATLSGSYNGTGTISFTLTAPDASTSTVGSVTVNGNGTYQSPSCPLLTQVGTYTWHASYSGDSLNNGAVDNGANESVTSVKATPTLVTNASTSGDAVVGTDTTCDSATLSGSYNGSGTITFTLTAPDHSTTQVGDPVTVNGNGKYDSPECPLLTQVGTYTWHAVYSGDSLNNGAEDNGANESVTSIPTTPSIVTTQDPATGSVGDTYKDTATLSNTYQLDGTGSITWTLYPNSDCSGDPLGTDTVLKVGNNGPFETPTGVTVNAAGTYYWVAHFSGDSNNGEATSGCADEPVVVKGASIHILKTADAPQVNAGDQIGFTLTVTNSGDGDAKNVNLSDPLPTNPGLSWQIADQGAGWNSTCKITAGELDCGPVTVPAGTTQANSTFTVHITSGTTGATGGDCEETGIVDNTGSVTAGNDGSDQSEATVCVAAPAIHIVKTADAPQVSAGEQIGFTLTVSNSGAGDAYNVNLSDPLPTNPGLSWQIAGQGAGWNSTCKIKSGELDCGPVTVPAGTTQANSTFTVHITSSTTGATGGDCEESGLVDNTGFVTTGNDGSDQSSAEICVKAPAIHIAKTADAAQVEVGDNIGFTMTVWNDGIGDAHGVVLSDVLPTNPGLSWSIDSTGAGFGDSCSIAAGVLSCGPVTVPAGTTQAESTYTVHITSGTTGATGGDCPETGVVNNTGDVTTSNDGSDESSASTCVQALVDLSITKSGSPGVQELNPDGSTRITWTMVVTNNGPSSDSGVKVSDPMPAGNTFVSATSTQGTCTGGAILNCDIGTMAAGASVTITLVTTPSTAGTQTNTAIVSGDRSETNNSNNTATATVEITAPITPPCVKVSRITPGHLIVGRKTTVTIHLTQGGKAAAGFKVRIKGAGVNVVTKRSNAKGITKHVLKMKKKGVLTFSAVSGPNGAGCSGTRIGVRGVFTPPVTG